VILCKSEWRITTISNDPGVGNSMMVVVTSWHRDTSALEGAAVGVSKPDLASKSWCMEVRGDIAAPEARRQGA